MPENRLTHEKSPYLLHHARDPVDWFPWSEEAFQKARCENKPVFLSIGYFACHWCHVMARESFQNPLVSGFMNERFIAVKVDREERPDLDAYYMKAVAEMRGSGGWPLSVFLTPEGRPFYGGTYFSPAGRNDIPSFLSVLQTVDHAWRENRGDMEKTAAFLARGLEPKETGKAEVGRETYRKAFEGFARDFDDEYGGFGAGAKFPSLPAILFLTRYGFFSGERRGFEMAERTLDSMVSGGIYDHVGGGFYRYATDRAWRVPHFEKMLYDQALGAIACAEAFQITGREAYRRAAEETIAFVLGEMRGNEGGFYASFDADSPLPDDPSRSEEGAYYLWTEDEISAVLGTRDAAVFLSVYSLAPFDGAGRGGVLYRARKASAAAVRSGMTVEETGMAIAAARQKLAWIRSRRPAPPADGKILADWNGLMISALSLASRALGRPEYATAAAACADFIMGSMRPGGTLKHRHFEGAVDIEGMLYDYAYLLNGLIDLYQATFEPRWLSGAMDVGKEMLERLYDREKGGFFLSIPDIVPETRQKDIADNALPSGNAAAAQGLLRLYTCTHDEFWIKPAQETLEHFAGAAAAMPSACPQYFAARYMMEYGTGIVIAEGDKEGAGGLRKVADNVFLPETVVALRPADERLRAEAAAVMPFIEEQRPPEGRSAAFICGHGICHEPVTDPRMLRSMLTDMRDVSRKSGT